MAWKSKSRLEASRLQSVLFVAPQCNPGFRSLMVDCPCCNNKINKLEPFMGGKWKCSRGHIFTLDFAPEASRVLIVEGSTDQSCQKGDRFPVATDAKWD